MKLIPSLLIATASSLIISCNSGKYYDSSTQSRAYLSAKRIPTLKTPPGVSKPAYKSRYPVKNQSYSDQAKQVNLVPPGLYA